MYNYQSIHLDDLLEQIQTLAPMQTLSALESLHAPGTKNATLLSDDAPINNLIDTLSMVEIASIIRLVAEPLPKEINDIIRTAESSSFFRDLASLDSANSLLSSLFNRVANGRSIHEGDEECFASFYQFNILSAGLREDEAILYFISLINDPRVQDSLDRYLSSPGAFAEGISQSNVSHSLCYFLVGLNRFLDICQDFNNLLKGLKRFPLFQSALWHYNARIIRRPDTGKVFRLLAKLEDWTRMENDFLFQNSPKVSLSNKETALSDLTSGIYERALHLSLHES